MPDPDNTYVSMGRSQVRYHFMAWWKTTDVKTSQAQQIGSEFPFDWVLLTGLYDRN